MADSDQAFNEANRRNKQPGSGGTVFPIPSYQKLRDRIAEAEAIFRLLMDNTANDDGEQYFYFEDGMDVYNRIEKFLEGAT